MGLQIKNKKNTIINIDADPALNRRPIVFTPKKPIINIPTYHLKADKLDNRDYLYQPLGVDIASSIDLRPFCSPIENQGALGSCTGQAVAGAIELINKRNRKPNDVSRLYIYYYERLLLGTVNYDSGAYIRDGIKATNKWGAPVEHLWPYIINRFRSSPTARAIKDGSLRKVTRYERILDFDGCINALANGFPVIIGFMVYSSFNLPIVYRTGIMPYPNIYRERFLGGHAVLLVGYDMNSQRFIARNSWGVNWGHRGYFYMPFDVIKDRNMSMDFWIIIGVNNP